ncbi:NAD-dependent epimerase/dehydratase family protein, partial [Escherichia coli]|nr:NAD-dependent epimerase/dehydratase family protein [Escherichia coli]
MSYIIVTGGAGFIGFHLVDKLITQGHKVIVVDNLSTGKKENVNKKSKFYKIDIC